MRVTNRPIQPGRRRFESMALEASFPVSCDFSCLQSDVTQPRNIIVRSVTVLRRTRATSVVPD